MLPRIPCRRHLSNRCETLPHNRRYAKRTDSHLAAELRALGESEHSIVGYCVVFATTAFLPYARHSSCALNLRHLGAALPADLRLVRSHPGIYPSPSGGFCDGPCLVGACGRERCLLRNQVGVIARTLARAGNCRRAAQPCSRRTGTHRALKPSLRVLSQMACVLPLSCLANVLRSSMFQVPDARHRTLSEGGGIWPRCRLCES